MGAMSQAGIVPDTKDWTWVLRERCPDCGFDASAVDPAELGPMIRDNARGWLAVLAQPGATERPDESTWSPLEYACHVRDVNRRFSRRLRLMLDEADPQFENWDQDVTAVESRYDLAEAGPTATKVTAAAERISSLVAGVSGDQWERPGRRSDGSSFTVESFTRYLVHDPLHHVWDIERGFASLG